jgi:hypothetical protein
MAQAVSTEAEQAFMALDVAELREAGEYIERLIDQFEQSRGHDGLGGRVQTLGPRFALYAMKLAWHREVMMRYGAEPWFAGMPTASHTYAKTLDWFAERIPLIHESERHIDVQTIDQQRCAGCKRRFTPEQFPLMGDGPHRSIFCAACHEDGAMTHEARQLAVEDNERFWQQTYGQSAPVVDEEEQQRLARQMVGALEQEELFG